MSDPVRMAAETLARDFARLSARQHELLVNGQTLASASRHWDEHPEAFSLDLQPLLEALALPIIEWEARYRSFVAALRAHEWSGTDWKLTGPASGETWFCCFACKKKAASGHASDCWLAALLEDAAPETPTS